MRTRPPSVATSAPMTTAHAWLLVMSLSPSLSNAQQGSFTTSGVGCPSEATVLPGFDDRVLGPFNLGFTFPHVGGSTTAIEVSTDGYVYLEPGTIADSRCCQPSISRFLSESASIAVFGADLNPASMGAIYFHTDGNVATIEWRNVPEFGQASGNSFQCQLQSSGDIRLSYTVATQTTVGSELLVGYSPGHGTPDPGPTDLSGSPGTTTGAVYELFDAVPSTPQDPFDLQAANAVWIFCQGPPFPLPFWKCVFRPWSVYPSVAVAPELSISGPPSASSSTTLTCSDLHPGTTSAALLLDTVATTFPLDLIGMPGCTLYSGAGIATIPMTVSPGGGRCAASSTATTTLAFGPSSIGLSAEVQVAAISPGVNALGVSMSNGGTMTIGQ